MQNKKIIYSINNFEGQNFLKKSGWMIRLDLLNIIFTQKFKGVKHIQ